MRSSISLLRSLCLVFLLSLIPALAAPSIERIDALLPYNFAVPGSKLSLSGRELSNVSLCKLVSVGGAGEYSLELLSVSQGTLQVKLPDARSDRALIPVGEYKVRIGWAGGSSLSTASFRLLGVVVNEFTAASLHSNPTIVFSGGGVSFCTRGYLVADDGTVYGPWKSHAVDTAGARLTGIWSAVPAGSYTVVLKNEQNLTLWKSPSKFRAIANPTQ